jgi:Cu(I)/Ag(I) efflux system membrane protein CusA/SilA
MVGGMITAPLLSMFVIPAVYLLLRRRDLGIMGKHPEGRTSR